MQCHKIFLIILFCITLIGCGKIQEKNTINEAQNVPDNSDVRDKDVSSEDYSDVEEIEVGITDSSFGIQQETEEPEKEVSGGDDELIVMRVLEDESHEYGDIRIEGLSLKTGQRREIAVFPNNFEVESLVSYDLYITTFPVVECRKGNYRDLFSKDYTKAAAHAVARLGRNTSDYDTHAGWIDINGTFTDVIENFHTKFPYNFGHRLLHKPMGFDEDYFYFMASEYITDSSSTDVCYRVRIDDETGESLERLSYSRFYNEINDQEYRTWYEDSDKEQDNIAFKMTDWLDEAHVLGDGVSIYLTVEPLELSCESHIVLFDTQAKEISSFIPKEYGMSRNGIISPDGKSVAFLMNPVDDKFNGLGIYIKGLDTDEIIAIKTDLSEQFTDVFYSYSDGAYIILPKLSLLEWSTKSSEIFSQLEKAKDTLEETTQGYTDEQLCDMARAYYMNLYGYEPSDASVDHVTGDMVTIHLYDVIYDTLDDGSTMSHMSTCDWYEINRYTGKGINLMGEEINLVR